MESGKGGWQDPKRDEVAAILERVQQAPQGRRLINETVRNGHHHFQKTEGVGESLNVSPTPLGVIRNRGAA